MGKPKNKKKKKKNEDFKKKRVKVGKRLPKADNYTDTSFKTQTIQVLQHIRTKDSALPTTKRNLSIKDLLSQCQHYNASIRQDGVNGLRELLKEHPDLLTDNLSQVLRRTAELFTDKESTVRQANHRLLRAILPLVNDQALNAFFPQVSAHLCCAMTHIDEDRQQHSLGILDLFLEHFPKQVIRNSGQLLPNFIQQISLLRQSGSGKGCGKVSRSFDSGMVRTLSMNPSSKLSSIKWRLNVMQRLSRVLSVIIEEEGSHILSVNTWHGGTGHRGDGTNHNTNGATVIKWSEYEQDQQVILRFNDMYRLKKNSNSSDLQFLGDKSRVQSFVKTIIPLILECWVECSPEVKRINSEMPISPDFLPILASMAELLKLICQYVDLSVQAGILEMRGWLSHMYGADLVHRLMLAFPYSTYTTDEYQIDEQIHKSRKKSKGPNRQECLFLEKQLNLDVCNILSYLAKDNCENPMRQINKAISIFVNYIENLMNRSQMKKTLLRSVVQIVEQLLSTEDHYDVLSSLMDSMLYTYNSVPPFSTEKVILTEFFLRLVEKQRDSSLHDVCDHFLSTLPNLLVQMVTSGSKSGRVSQEVQPIIWAIKQASCQKKSSLQLHLQAELINIFNLVPMVEPNLQHDILEMMYRLDHFTDKQLNKVVLLSRSTEVAVEKIGFVLEILQHRLTRSEATSEEINQYFSLLFSIALGHSQKELTSLPGQSDPNVIATSGTRQGPIVVFSAEPNTSSRHCDIVKIVTSLLTRWPNTSQVQIIMDRFLSDLLERYALLTEETALGVVSIAHTVNIHELYMSQVSGFLACLCQSMLHQLKYMKNITEGIWSRTTLRDELWHIAVTFLKLPTHSISQLLTEGIHL